MHLSLRHMGCCVSFAIVASKRLSNAPCHSKCKRTTCTGNIDAILLSEIITMLTINQIIRVISK
jgi:hypothetical protein